MTILFVALHRNSKDSLQQLLLLFHPFLLSTVLSTTLNVKYVKSRATGHALNFSKGQNKACSQWLKNSESLQDTFGIMFGHGLRNTVAEFKKKR